ncbi:MAG: DUF2178 domain-containing protein [Chitinophagales bacterium]
MSKNRIIIKFVALVIMLLIGIWAWFHGKTDIATGLIGASIGVFVINVVKDKRIADMKAKGLNPHDERAVMVSGKAASMAITCFVLVSAVVVLVGSIWGPKIAANPFNLIGLCMTLLIFIYVGFYYYYSHRM